jgi:hypothetical protein
MRVPWIVFGTVETATLIAAQVEAIPTDLLSIFVQLPLIGLFAWYVLKKDRDTREWIDHLMEDKDKQQVKRDEDKDKQFSRVIDLFEKIIDRQDNRQTDLVTSIGAMERTLTLNTATVSESIRLSELVDELKK